MPTSLPVTTSDMLAALQTGDRTAAAQLAASTGPWLRARAASMCPDLQRAGLTEDVVQETYCLLLSRPEGHFKPELGSAATYLALQIREAGNRVRAVHSMPGWTRRRKDAKDTENAPKGPVHLDPGESEPAEVRAAMARVAGEDDATLRVLNNVCLRDFCQRLPADDGWVGDVVTEILEGVASIDQVIVGGRSRFAVRRRVRVKRADMVESGLLSA